MITYANGNRYISLEYIAEFLEYKRPSTIINKLIKSSNNIIDGKFIEIKEAITHLFGNKRDKMKDLLAMLLSDTQQQEIDIIIDKFNEVTENKFNFKKDFIPKVIQNIWYMISSKNVDIINENRLNFILNVYGLTEKEGIKLINMEIGECVYNPKEEQWN